MVNPSVGIPNRMALASRRAARRALLATLLFTALMVPTAAQAQTERQLGAHEHGTGRLDISVDGPIVQFELVAPGDDIVGFEHKPSTPAHFKRIADAKAVMASPLTLFGLTAKAGCTVTGTTVTLQKEAKETPLLSSSPAKATRNAKAAEPAKDDGGHNEFHVTTTFSCTAPSNFSDLSFAYFQKFPKAKKLIVNVTSANGQKSFTVDRAKPKIRFGSGS